MTTDTDIDTNMGTEHDTDMSTLVIICENEIIECNDGVGAEHRDTPSIRGVSATTISLTHLQDHSYFFSS